MPVTADAAAVNPRLVQLDRHVVDEVADLEIVRAVEDQVGVLAQLDDVRPVDVGDDRFDANRRVDGPELERGGLGLGHMARHVALVEENLALEVARLHEIAVDDADVPDAGPHQDVRQHRSQRAAAAQGDARAEQFPLALFAHAVETHLSAVSF